MQLSWSFFLRAAAVSSLGLSACSAVRGASVGDLVEGVPDQGQADSGALNDDNVQRLATACATPPTVTPAMTVRIPAGPFQMGCNVQVDKECRTDEMPPHMVMVDDFSIDATEVSQSQYWECVNAGACKAPTCDWDPCGARANHPVVCVDRKDAEAYCAFRGQRLPTEAEWEKAARGTDSLVYPWGNDGLDCDRANIAGCVGPDGKQDTVEVGLLVKGASPYGVLDMAGNVVEWVADVYDPSYYAQSPGVDPPGPSKSGSSFVGRGGGWHSAPVWERTSQRDDYEGVYFKNSLGIRCAN